MKAVRENIYTPSLGCKLGQAYWIMLGQLAKELRNAELDVTTSEYLVLRAVYCREGLQQCEIADSIGKDKASVCRIVAALEAKELVSTESISHKCLRVFLTEKSRLLEPRIKEVAHKRHDALTEMIGPGEVEQFTRIIENIINSK